MLGERLHRADEAFRCQKEGWGFAVYTRKGLRRWGWQRIKGVGFSLGDMRFHTFRVYIFSRGAFMGKLLRTFGHAPSLGVWTGSEG